MYIYKISDEMDVLVDTKIVSQEMDNPLDLENEATPG